MNNYLITYDLHSPYRNYSFLIERIKTAPFAKKITESCRFIKSELTAIQIAKQLELLVDSTDLIFVTEMKNCGWSASLDIDTQKYLNTYWYL